jgi:hypothetical protein
MRYLIREKTVVSRLANKIKQYNFYFLFLCLLAGTNTLCADDKPAPNIKNTKVQASALFKPDTGTYIYSYDVVSSINNRGRIVGIELNIRTEMPVGQDRFNNLLVDLMHKDGWASIDSFGFDYRGWYGGDIYPGETVKGFQLRSNFTPTIRRMRVEPSRFDFGLYAREDDTDEVKRQMEQFVESLNKYIETLGPMDNKPGSYGHWNQFQSDLVKAMDLGWIVDRTLAEIMVGQLRSAWEAQDAGGVSLAKSRLEMLIEQASSAAESQLRQEARELVILNAKSLIKNAN